MGILTPPGVLAFAHVMVPRPRAKNRGPEYSAILIFDEHAQKHPLYAELKKDVMSAIESRWGAAKAKDAAFVKSLTLPFRDAGEKAGRYDGFKAGQTFIQPWSKMKPGVVDKGRVDIVDPSDVWAGQIARFDVKAFPWESSGNMGVSFSLNHVQILRTDTPRLDGRKSAADAFNDGTSSSDDDGDDGLPF